MAGVRVDLSAGSVAADVRNRFELLAKVAYELLAGTALHEAEIFLNEFELARAVEAYFLISEAYKHDKLGHSENEPHWTESSKKAAFTALTLMIFRPFRFVAPGRPLVHPLSTYANQVLALTSAATLMERDFPNLTWESQRRIFQLLDRIGVGKKTRFRSRALRDYVRDQMAGHYQQVYTIDIDQDQPLIDLLILLFESPLGH